MQSISAQGTPPDAEESESPEAILDEFVEDAVEQYDGPAEDQVQSSQLPTRQGKRWKFWKKYEAGQKTYVRLSFSNLAFVINDLTGCQLS